MKTLTPRLLNMPLLLLILLAGAPVVEAYYDPGVQRWINRDPAVDPAVTSSLGTHRHANQFALITARTLKLYVFVVNTPVIRHDPFGFEDDQTVGELHRIRRDCDKAKKLLKQFDRLAQKFGCHMAEWRIKQLKEKGNKISSNDLPGSLQREFPSRFQGLILEEIEAQCKEYGF